jgi:hypothetical protein
MSRELDVAHAEFLFAQRDREDAYGALRQAELDVERTVKELLALYGISR